MKKEKIYSSVFPMWMLLLIPTTWIIMLPLNYVWDTIILLIAFCIVKVEKKAEVYKNCIIRVWFFGILSSLLGATIASIPEFLTTRFNIFSNIGTNPYKNVWLFIFVILGILVSYYFTYTFNKKYSFSRTGLDHIRRKRIAKIVAVFTLPYLFLVPSNYIYKYINNNQIINISKQNIQDNTFYERNLIKYSNNR